MSFSQGWIPLIEQALRSKFATRAQGLLAESSVQASDMSNFATASQGALADTALQPAAIQTLANVNVRQAIQSARVNATTGQADFLQASGLVVSTVGPEPLIVAVTDTPEASGRPRDRVQAFASTLTWPTLTANSTTFLFIRLNAIIGGAPTLIIRTVTPSFGEVRPPSPVTGQWHYDPRHLGPPVVWNGSAWEPQLEICVGEATTGASAVTGLASYAILGQWLGTTSTTSTASEAININHHIGTQFVGLGNLWLRDVTNSRWVLKGFPQGYSPDTVRDANLSAITTTSCLFNVNEARFYRHNNANVVPSSWFFRLSLNRGF